MFDKMSSMPRTNYLVVQLLCAALLLSGCFSYQAATTDERDELMTDPGEDIEVTLSDGATVQADGYSYVFSDTAGQYIHGKGECINVFTGESTEFSGKLLPLRSESGSRLKSEPWRGFEKVHYRDFWVSESVKVRMQEGSYVSVDVETSATMLYVTQAATQPDYSQEGVSQGIPVEQIESVDIRKFSPSRTIGMVGAVLVGGALVVGMVAVIAAGSGIGKGTGDGMGLFFGLFR